MPLQPDHYENVVILTPASRLDQAHAEAFSHALAPWLEQCSANDLTIVLDFSKVPQICAEALHVLMLAARQVKTRRGQLVLSALQPTVAEAFKISGFHFYFKIFHGRRDAVAALARPLMAAA